MVLLLCIVALAWLAVAAFVVMLCRTAAHSDEALAQSTEVNRGRVFLPGVLVWRDAPELAARDLRPAEQPERVSVHA